MIYIFYINIFYFYICIYDGTVTPRSDDGDDENPINEDYGRRTSAFPYEKRTPVIVTATGTSQPK